MTTPVSRGDVMSSNEVADFLGIHGGNLAVWRSRGQGPKYIKLNPGKGAGVIYFRHDVEAWMKENAGNYAVTRPYAMAGAR